MENFLSKLLVLVHVWNPVGPRVRVGERRGSEIGSDPLTPPPPGSQNFHTRSEPQTETQGGGRKPTVSEPLTRPPFHQHTLALSKSTCYYMEAFAAKRVPDTIYNKAYLLGPLCRSVLQSLDPG